MEAAALPWAEAAGVAGALAVAAAFRPWGMLRRSPLQHPWLAALALLPWVWSSAALVPGALPMQLSLAGLMVLMFGWPLAMWTCLPAAALAAWLADAGSNAGAAAWPWQALHTAWWNGVLPGTLALLAGLATRRWLPRHLMVYILGRSFAATLLAMAATGALWVLTQPLPRGNEASLLLVGRWLMAWGDAVATGMLTAIFVAFRPQWLATYSDARYLPGRPG
jgi:uncharacterized membrane protein